MTAEEEASPFLHTYITIITHFVYLRFPSYSYYPPVWLLSPLDFYCLCFSDFVSFFPSCLLPLRSMSGTKMTSACWLRWSMGRWIRWDRCSPRKVPPQWSWTARENQRKRSCDFPPKHKGINNLGYSDSWLHHSSLMVPVFDYCLYLVKHWSIGFFFKQLNASIGKIKVVLLVLSGS